MTDRGRHAGQQFGNYLLLHLMGSGGFAEVYLAAHLHLETQAAVKVLQVHMRSQSLEQFRQEARTIAHLQHPHIVRVLEFGFEDTTPFLVMDYAPGGTLRMLHPKGTRLPLQQVVSYVKQVAAALAYAHEQHIVHRDIKPENMLLSARHEVLLSDFGIAVVQRVTSSLSTQKPAGTPLYMAPEQIMGRPHAASDQYALAAVAYEWLCGEPPFHGSVYEVWSQHLHRPPPPLREKAPNLSPAVEDAILGALAKDPRQRFVSVQEFAEVLENTSLPTPPSSRALPAAMLLPQSSPQHLDEASLRTRLPMQPGVTPPSHAESRSPRHEAIRKYLEFMQARYSSIPLPLGPAEGFSLQAVFQPLTLCKDPIAAEDRPREERRHLLGEPVHDEDRPRVIATNGEDALAKSLQRRMVVLGGPGTGKTTLLQSLISERIAQAQRDLTSPLSILLSLPDLACSGKTFQEYLIRLAKEAGLPDRSADILWMAIEDGRAFICLDSLDEVRPRQRPEMIRLVNELASRPGNTWVVGSRFSEYKGGQFKRGQFAEWELQPLDHDLRLQLAQRLLPELHRLLSGRDAPSEDEPAVFVRTLEFHQRAAAWGENPLLFSLAAVVFARTGALPSSRAALYQQVTDAIFETREQDPTRRKMQCHVAADLALDLYRTKGRTFTRDDLVLLLPELRQRQRENWATEEMVNHVVTSGILDVVAQETYGFRHQTFQEYLTAVALAQRLVSQDQATREEGWSLAWSKRGYSRWTGVLRLMVGVLVQGYRREGARQAQHWLRALVGQRTAPEGDIANLGLALALESLPEVSETKTGNWRAERGEQVEAEIVTSWVAAAFSDIGALHDLRQGHLIQQLRDPLQFPTDTVGHFSEHAAKMAVEQLSTKLSAENWQARLAAVQALQRVREWVPVESVLAFSHDKKSEVRRAIVELLGSLGERVPVDALLSALGDEDSWVRWSAEAMLLQNRGRIPATRLIPLLHAEDWPTRTSAAKVLAQLGVHIPVEPFLADLNERNWERRWAAVQVLGKLGADAPIEPLFAALGDQEINVQWAAAEALGELHAYVPLERLVDALHDSDPTVRKAAVKVLGYRGTPPVMPPGSTTIPVHPGDTSVNTEGMHTSRESDLHTLVDLLLRMLRDADPFVRTEAARALVGLSEAVPVLVKPLAAALEDEYWFVRVSAAESLGNIRVGVPVEPLLKALADEDKSVRKAAAQALGKMGRRPPEEFLLGGIGRRLAWMQATAVQALCNMPEHVPIKVFEDMLSHENAQLRARAAKALGQCGDRAPIEPLLIALQDEDVRVRVAAAEALGKFGERTPLEPLVSMLNDEALQVREEVARTLGTLGERVPLELFLQALGDEHASVRAAAVNVLGELGPCTPVEPLLGALHDPEPSVRCWTAWALGKLGKPAAIEPLIAALQDEDHEVRAAAIEALEQLAEDVSLEWLLALLDKGDEKIGIAVWQVVANLGKPLPVEMLADALSHPEEQVRLAAIKVIGEMREATLVERLWDLLKDMDASLSSEGIYSTTEALSQLVEHVPIELLRQAVKSKQWQVRLAAVRILGQLKELAPVDALLTALDDNDWRVTASAARALAGLGVRAPLERLFTLLREGGQDQRQAAAEALGEIGGRIPLEPLLAAVDEEDDFIREAVITALGKLEGPEPIEPLVAALGDSEKHVRDAAMETLHQTHPEALLAVVPEAIAIVQGGESGNVLGSMEQGVIAEAIGNLGYDSPILLEKLTQLLDWPYWEVQMKAAQALGTIRRNIPDATIRRLLELRHDSRSRTVCVAANNALAEILSLETGIEDDL